MVPTIDATVQMEEVLRGDEDCSCPLQCAAEVRSLSHLERQIDTASSSIVVIAFYSRVRSLTNTLCAWCSAELCAHFVSRSLPSETQ